MSEIFGSILPGMMYFWVLFIGQTPMQEVLNEKEINTLARILASPVTLPQFVLSKMIRCFLLCSLIQMLLLMISSWAFHMNWGSAFHLGAVVAASSFSMTGLLAFIYSAARTKEQANVMSTVSLMICAMMGGSMFPFEQLPRFLQAIGQFTPNRWGILAMQRTLQSQPLGELLVPLAILCAIGVAGSVAGYFLFQRQLIKVAGK